MNERYLVYKTSGGLYHMLRSINIAVNLCKKTGRTLIIDTNAHAFRNDFNKYFTIPSIEYHTTYDVIEADIRKDLSLKKLIDANCKHQKGLYYLNDLLITPRHQEVVNSTEKFVFFSFLKRTRLDKLLIRLGMGRNYEIPWNIDVTKSINALISNNKITVPYIGVHFRNTDIVTDPNPIVQKIRKLNCRNIYLATDDSKAYDTFSRLLGKNYNIFQFTKPLELKAGQNNIHYANPDKDEVILNALIDTYHLKRADYFLASRKSSFSHRIQDFRKNNNFIY